MNVRVYSPDNSARDPGVLQLFGKIAEFVGLVEHAERILDSQRKRSESRHRAIAMAWGRFQRALISGRGALRQIQSTIASQVSEAPPDTIALALSYGEFQIFRDGMEQLHRAIGEMTAATYELEALTQNVDEERVRFYRISEAGRPTLELLKHVLDGHPDQISELLVTADRHFDRCDRLIADRNRWLER